jgi:hypothetical protein
MGTARIKPPISSWVVAFAKTGSRTSWGRYNETENADQCVRDNGGTQHFCDHAVS